MAEHEDRRRGAGGAAGLALVAAMLVVVAYLGGTFAFPGTVPRLSMLPKPGPDRVWNDGCNDHSESWKRDGLFWVRWKSSTLALCVNQA